MLGDQVGWYLPTIPTKPFLLDLFQRRSTKGWLMSTCIIFQHHLVAFPAFSCSHSESSGAVMGLVRFDATFLRPEAITWLHQSPRGPNVQGRILVCPLCLRYCFRYEPLSLTAHHFYGSLETLTSFHIFEFSTSLFVLTISSGCPQSLRPDI